jgi:hypothetical protein
MDRDARSANDCLELASADQDGNLRDHRPVTAIGGHQSRQHLFGASGAKARNNVQDL